MSISAGGLSACDSYPSASGPSGCGSNTALIAVRDGYLENLCGCTEPSGQTANSGQTLTCTVAKGTSVVFDFAATRLPHQIVSTGTGATTFPSSPIRNPEQSDSIPNHAVQLTSSGTYPFNDRFEPGISGQLIVP